MIGNILAFVSVKNLFIRNSEADVFSYGAGDFLKPSCREDASDGEK
jgi:hypothetical protein